MNETTKYIHKTIYQIATECCGKQQWLKYRHNVRLLLEKLKPDIPEDGTCNRIAFNVGDDKPRMKIKTGRFLTKKLQLNSGYLNDVAIQKIATMINFHLFGTNTETKLLNGSKITEAYENEIGTSSCMTGNCADYTRLYESNPSRFQMLIMSYENNSARAIVHKLDNGEYLLDRVYSDCETLKDKMKDYARDNGWYYRKSDDAATSTIYRYDCKIDDYNKMIVSGLSYDDGEVPYMDTLTEYRLNGSKMDIFHCQYSSGYSADGTLDSQNGDIENLNRCEDCGGTMHDDDTYHMNDYAVCRGCYEENYFYCEHCEEYGHNDDSVHIEDKGIYVCQHCADHNYYYCNDCHTHNAESFETSYGENICESCLENYYCCDDCNEYFTSDDITDGYCEDCKPEEEENDDDDNRLYPKTKYPATMPKQNENDTEKLPFTESVRNVE